MSFADHVCQLSVNSLLNPQTCCTDARYTHLRNDLYCVEWGVKLYSNQPSQVCFNVFLKNCCVNCSVADDGWHSELPDYSTSMSLFFFAFFALCCIVSSFCSIYSPLSSKMFLIGNYWKQLLNAHCLQKLDYTFTFEVIVVDDGSTDKTTKVCCMYLLLVDVYFSNCDSSVFSETMLSYWLGIGKDIVLYKNTCKQSGMVSFWRWSMQLWSMEK